METGAKNARQGRTSFLLQHQKTVFCRRGPSDDRRQEKHKEALAEKADQAMTPPLRFSCESLRDTRPGQGAGATAGPSRGRTGKVQRPAGEDRALHHCPRRRRPQAPCARDQRRTDQAYPGILFKGSFTGFALCGLAFPFWARSWRARTNISCGSRIKSRRFKSRLRRRYIPGCCKVTFYMFFSLTGKESPQTREGEVIALKGLVFFSHSTPV